MSKLIDPGPEFERLFREFEHTAYRLEVREGYAPAYELEDFQKFLAGEPYELTWMRDWLSMVREATQEGRRFARVRVVNLPPSDYSRWSLAVAPHNIAAGEDIRYLARNRAQETKLPDHDYWLFDSRTLLLMKYDEADRFIGGEIVDDSTEVVQHNYWRDVAWHYAIKLDEFVTEEQLGRP